MAQLAAKYIALILVDKRIQFELLVPQTYDDPNFTNLSRGYYPLRQDMPPVAIRNLIFVQFCERANIPLQTDPYVIQHPQVYCEYVIEVFKLAHRITTTAGEVIPIDNFWHQWSISNMKENLMMLGQCYITLNPHANLPNVR